MDVLADCLHKLPACRVRFIKVLGKLKHIALKIKATIQKWLPELHIDHVKKIFEAQKNTIKQLFAPGGTSGDKKGFSLS